MKAQISWIFLLVFTSLQTTLATTIEVGKGKIVQSINEAVLAAQPGDTLLVMPGEYKEHSIIINKKLVLIGKDKPKINADSQKVEIFVILADSVVIDGFVLLNISPSYLKDLAAIKIKQSRGVVIRNNEIRNSFFGIYIEYGKHCLIEHNQIIGSADVEASAGNAIHVWKGDNIEISNNQTSGHRDGIYFEFVDDSYIHHNHSIHNIRYGLHFMFSNRDKYLFNEFRENGAGVAVMFSSKIEMIENVFAKNWGGAAYGLLLKEISDAKIISNHFIQNTVGITAEGASRIVMQHNQFTSNGTALDIKGNSIDMQISSNNFLANTFEVVTNTKHNTNLYESNYWSAYQGYDLNRDGIGDEPYRPVSLFAKITNEIPAATILLHSIFVNLLEVLERIFPQMIPQTLIDLHPQMKPYHYD